MDVDDEERARQHLLWRIHRRYQTVTQPLRIGPLSLPFTRIADPDTVLDAVAAEEDRLEKLRGRVPEDQLHLPYWAALWDSAAGISQWLVENADKGTRGRVGRVGVGRVGVRSRAGEAHADTPYADTHSLPPVPLSPCPLVPLSVLDLGCGMGLAGTVAAAVGHRVLFADLEAPALLFARLNSLPFARRTRFRRLDWRSDRLDERFDLILGADILYERKQWDYLEPFWQAHLRDGGTILLGEPGRQTGDLFIEWIQARPWRLTQHERRVATREKPIRLFELRREMSH